MIQILPKKHKSKLRRSAEAQQDLTLFVRKTKLLTLIPDS
jgi:hypothetical protein